MDDFKAEWEDMEPSPHRLWVMHDIHDETMVELPSPLGNDDGLYDEAINVLITGAQVNTMV